MDIIGGDVGGVREDDMDDGIERLWGQERIGELASNQGLSRECVVKAVIMEVWARSIKGLILSASANAKAS